MEIPAEEKLTLPQIFQTRVEHYQTRQALAAKDKISKQYRAISWLEWAEAVRKTALGLYRAGVQRGDRVAILSENRPEWTYADFGILSLGAVVVPIYPTSSPEDVSYILQNAGVRAIFLSGQEQLDRLWEVLEGNTVLQQVITFDTVSKSHPKIFFLQDLDDGGRLEGLNNEDLYKNLLAKGAPDDTATIIYTSGTTGPPKGVMLSHHNFVANYLGARKNIKISESDSAMSFLPLSHVFERLAGYYFMTFHGVSTSYAENMQTVAEDIQEVRPTICAAVPRFYEKVYAKVLEQVETGPKIKKKIFDWAVQVGRARLNAVEKKQRMPRLLWAAYGVAKLLVFNKIKRKMGGRIRFFISGGAPLAKELAEFFFAADVLILEGYGLTETSPVIAVNTPTDFRFGTVGRPLPNVEVKIAPDGEILTQGPCVMKGYYQNPEATREAMEGGWFHTGDIGTFEDGFLKITDRKKDIIATSGGKKVSPQNIENRILSDSLFQQVVIVGDKRNYLVALVVPHQAQVLRQAQALGLQDLAYEKILGRPEIFRWIEERFRKRTEGLASYEQIKYFSLLRNELTQENGELTPTLKYKRRFIMEKYRDLIEEMYHRKSDAGDLSGVAG